MCTKKYKYPHTKHLPWSEGITKDDTILIDCTSFVGKEIVVTEKLDGENTSLYRDYMHPRSLNYSFHSSRERIRAFHAQISYQIPEGWRICGENVYAKHSIHYQNLKSHFYAFSIWNENNVCLDWDVTVRWAGLLGLTLPHIFYRGIWDEKLLRALQIDTSATEGYVVRVTRSFAYEDFKRRVAKWVRKNHIKTTKFWKETPVIPNILRSQ